METLLFDLDGTLYPLDNGYHTHVVGSFGRRVRLGHFLVRERVESRIRDAQAVRFRDVACLRVVQQASVNEKGSGTQRCRCLFSTYGKKENNKNVMQSLSAK